MIRFIIYVGVGAAMHVCLVGDKFNFESAVTYAYLLAWPIMLIIAGFKWFMILIMLVIIGVCMYLIAAIIADKLTRRRIAKIYKSIRDRQF